MMKTLVAFTLILILTLAPAPAGADTNLQHAAKCREAGTFPSGDFSFSEYPVSRTAGGGTGVGRTLPR
jgi:hypothetical protein